jgi:hypothetical protein
MAKGGGRLRTPMVVDTLSRSLRWAGTVWASPVVIAVAAAYKSGRYAPPHYKRNIAAPSGPSA